jgi:hypothetical protein
MQVDDKSAQCDGTLSDDSTLRNVNARIYHERTVYMRTVVQVLLDGFGGLPASVTDGE